MTENGSRAGADASSHLATHKSGRCGQCNIAHDIRRHRLIWNHVIHSFTTRQKASYLNHLIFEHSKTVPKPTDKSLKNTDVSNAFRKGIVVGVLGGK